MTTQKREEALEAELLAALSDEPEEMTSEDWDRLRARVHQIAENPGAGQTPL
jgi:hypothetical protein